MEEAGASQQSSRKSSIEENRRSLSLHFRDARKPMRFKGQSQFRSGRECSRRGHCRRIDIGDSLHQPNIPCGPICTSHPKNDFGPEVLLQETSTSRQGRPVELFLGRRCSGRAPCHRSDTGCEGCPHYIQACPTGKSHPSSRASRAHWRSCRHLQGTECQSNCLLRKICIRCVCRLPGSPSCP